MNDISSIASSTTNSLHEQKTAAEQLEQQKKAEAAKEAERAAQESEFVPSKGILKPNVDEYIPSEKISSAGLYQLGKDEQGNPQIIFDGPGQQSDEKNSAPVDKSSADEMDGSNSKDVIDKQAKVLPEKADGDKEGDETCTCNTDKVDAEIKKLKNKAAGLEQQIAQAKDDPAKQQKLEKQLQQVESEIRMKDNDAYRRQHAEFTNSKEN